MKVLICSYADQVIGKVDDEIKMLRKHLPDVEITVKAYIDDNQLIEDLQGMDGLLSVFIPITDIVLKKASTLKVISLSSTGYSNVDIEAAKRNDIQVCHIKDYCTREVADHCMTLILSLTRRIPSYVDMVNKAQWSYDGVGPIRRLSDHILGLYGLGRIGQALATRAKAFGMKVVAVDPYLPQEIAESIEVDLVDSSYIEENCTIISNHMNATNENRDFFNQVYFNRLKQKPVFINVSRGDCVDEMALLEALNSGLIESVGLDVLKAEEPDLVGSPFINRPDIILTPHTAFYSEGSMEALKTISAMNLVYHFTGDRDKVFAYL